MSDPIVIDAEGGLVLPTIQDRTEHARALIRGLNIEDPKLYECLMILCAQLSETTKSISPIVTTLAARIPASVTLLPPTDFAYTLQPTTIRLTWTRPPLTGVLSYEVRFGAVNWDNADFVIRTQSTSIDVSPFSGLTGTYRVKTLNDIGDYSSAEATVDVVVVPPGEVTITAQVIDNNILLQWTEPTTGSFEIDYYEIERDGVLQGYIEGSFVSYFEVVSGSYEYTITPIDIAGNIGASASVTLQVNQPPDYVLQDEHVSDFSGTKVNALSMPGPALLVCIPSETWQNHFVTRTWLDPQDQIDDGYPIYIQPAELTASYEEVIDFGVLLSNVIATVRYNTEFITTVGTMLQVVKMATSPDNVTYSAFTNGPSQFLPSLRYLKIRLEFTASVDTLLMKIFNLLVNIAVKRENDGGEATAVSTDVGGTPVSFTKDFKDIESVTATVKTPQEPFNVVVDFVDIPDPVGFNVYVFDSSGNRVTKTIEWKARGVV